MQSRSTAAEQHREPEKAPSDLAPTLLLANRGKTLQASNKLRLLKVL